MIFKQKLIDRIKDGTKTQTRRVVKYQELLDLGYVDGRAPDDPEWVQKVGRVCRYKPGRSYAIQPGRGMAQVARITVTDVRCERLGAITADDARREGFARKGVGSTQMFFDYWRELYGKVDEGLLVFVVSFVYGHDQLRLLSTPVVGRSGDYTTAIGLTIDEGAEGVDEASQARITAEAQTHDELRAQKRLDSYDIAQRYAAARAESERLGVDISHHERAIKERLARIERANQQRKAA